MLVTVNASQPGADRAAHAEEGALLDDADAELAAMRPHLAAWWLRNGDEFRDRGVR
jgi:hypothetical protein